MTEPKIPRAAVVCGGRTYNNASYMAGVLADNNIDLLIEGGNKTWLPDSETFAGADYLAQQWALQNGIPVVTMPADWDTFGTRAGPIRNGQMAKELLRLREEEGYDVRVIAFAGGKGTEGMIKEAKRRKIRVIESLGTHRGG